MGTMARRYTRPVMGTFFLESRTVVKRARIWVMTVANTKCHVVRKMGKSGAGVRVRRYGGAAEYTYGTWLYLGCTC